MIVFLIILLVIVLGIGVYGIIEYNMLNKLQGMVMESFINLDEYFIKRWELLNDYAESMKNYVKYEEKLFYDYCDLKKNDYRKLDVNEKITINLKMNNIVYRARIVAKSYSNLLRDEHFAMLSNELEKIDAKIEELSKIYNSISKAYGLKVQMFPTKIINKMFKFSKFEQFA